MTLSMNNSTMKIRAVLRLLGSQGPEKNVPKFWLARTGSRLDRRFATSTPYSIQDFEDFMQIEVKDQIFLWPRNSPKAKALQILSEILTPKHPHQYLYGNTRIDKDDVVLDIGACEGAFAAAVTSRCKRVIAVEPSRSMCALIKSLFELRREECPEILNCLVGSESGSAYFFENISNPGGSRIVTAKTPGAYEVPVRTLDEIVEQLDYRPTFIKCDAEGAEIEIFSGGKNFLRTHHPKLAITTYHNDGDYAAMHVLLTSLGYRVAGKGFLFSGGGTLRVQMIHAW